MKSLAALLPLALAAACGGNSPSFTCMTDAQCTLASTPGMCVDKDASGKGVCALADGTCPSGFRFDTSAGAMGGQCVPPTNNDMAGDMAMPSTDDMGDMAQPMPDLTGDLSMRDLAQPPPDFAGADFAGFASVTTVTGRSGIAGYMDGSPAMATFDQPTGLATDGTNIFVSDFQTDIIRQVVIATSNVTTIGGTPNMAGYMDGAVGTAKFYQPLGLATDGAGNVFVADNVDCFLRQVVASTGVASALAGAQSQCSWVDGTGSAGHFFSIQSLWWAGSNTLYIGDGSRVRKAVISGTSAAISTLVTGAVPSGPITGIVGDGAGNLFIVDNSGCTVDRVVISTQAVTTLAGTLNSCGSVDGVGTAAKFRNPNSIAFDGAGSLYVSDLGSGQIRKIDISTKQVTTFAAGLGAPAGIAWYATGAELFVADAASQTVVKVK